MKNILYLFSFLILTVTTMQAQQLKSYQYVSPKPGSALNSRSTNIIIKQGEFIDRNSISSSLIEVTGSLSGSHQGRVILSDDNKTIIFQSAVKFSPKEKVTVNVKSGIKSLSQNELEPVSFSFIITPLENPLHAGLIANFKSEEETAQVEQNTNVTSKLNKKGNSNVDSLPSDFPKIRIQSVNNPADGYVFINTTDNVPGVGFYNMMIKDDGSPFWFKKYDHITNDFKMQPNGMISFADISQMHSFAGGGEAIHKVMDTNYAVVDSFQMGNGYIADSHDFQLLPNGHALLVGFDLEPVDMSLITPKGNPGAYVSGSIIQELDADKNVIFQWRSWDYFNIADSYFDLTLAAFDPIHINSINLTHDGNILFSSRNLSELTKIDRSTGNIIWRMGGRNNQFTFINEHAENAPLYVSRPHHLRILPNGNITVFDNGLDHKPTYSRGVEYQIDEVNKTATLVWEYRHPLNVYGATQGSVQRLPNGNTLICWGNGSKSNINWPAATEVHPDGTLAYELYFESPGMLTYRALRFPWKKQKDYSTVSINELSKGNEYSFNNATDSTFTNLILTSFTGSNYNSATVNKYLYAPVNPQFIAKAPVVLNKRVVVSFNEISSLNAEVYFDASKFVDYGNPDLIKVYNREFEGSGLFLELPTSYNPVTGKIKVLTSKMGEFIFGYPDLNSVVYSPRLILPKDSSSVNQKLHVAISWTPLGITNSFELQISKTADFNTLITDQTNMTTANYILNSVDTNSVYYWRVKSGNDVGISDWSSPFMFKTTAPSIKVNYPNGGEKLQIGLKYYIRWKDNIDEDVILELYKGNGFYKTIDTVASTGVFQWAVDLNLPKGTDYKIGIRSVTDSMLVAFSNSPFNISDTTTDVKSDKNNLPGKFELMQNYPNPFNPSTVITYRIAERSRVKLEIINILGEKIAQVTNEIVDAGTYAVTWNANVASGLYIYRIEAVPVGNSSNIFVQTKKMLLIR